jgi:peroxin-6
MSSCFFYQYECSAYFSSLPVSTPSPSEAVFFLVTNVEHDVVSSEDDGNLPDTYIGSTVGELGCWVDPHVTRMIQTGLEQSRVPDNSSHGRAGETMFIQYPAYMK